MYFYQVDVCWLLLALPLLVLLVRAQQRRLTYTLQALGDVTLFQHTPSRAPFCQRPWVRLFLLGVPVLCLILALADPRLPHGQPYLRPGAVDVVMIIDVSKSMAAEDYRQQSRLAKARDIMRSLLPAFPGNRVGLVTFAGSSFRQAELTEDRSALDFILQHWVNIDSVGVGGSKLVRALETGLAILPPETQREQMILLFSDGGDDAEDFQEVLAQAVKRRVKIIAFGLGSPQPSRIPLYDAEHRFKEFLQLNGQTVTTRLRPEPLQHIAATTHGVYLQVTAETTWTHLLTQSAVGGNALTRNEQRLFQIFLLMALLVCGLQVLAVRL